MGKKSVCHIRNCTHDTPECGAFKRFRDRDDLPGMWEGADLSGGWADTEADND